jgi:hypothetical protein
MIFVTFTFFCTIPYFHTALVINQLAVKAGIALWNRNNTISFRFYIMKTEAVR